MYGGFYSIIFFFVSNEVVAAMLGMNWDMGALYTGLHLQPIFGYVSWFLSRRRELSMYVHTYMRRTGETSKDMSKVV